MDLCQRMSEARGAGTVRCRIFPASAGMSRADGLALVGYHDLPDREWRVLKGPHLAIAELATILEHDLAYDVRCMSHDQAVALATEFVEAVGMDCRFVTNSAADRATWSPISDTTFDTGVVAESTSLRGICWFEDED